MNGDRCGCRSFLRCVMSHDSDVSWLSVMVSTTDDDVGVSSKHVVIVSDVNGSATKRAADSSSLESAEIPASKRIALFSGNGSNVAVNVPSVVNEKGVFLPLSQFSTESDNGADAIGKNGEDHKGRGCRCGKTKCLKLYCQCFGHGALCAPECVCTECYNDGKHEEERMMAVKERRRNNPDHFKGTDLEARNMEVRSPGGTVHTVRGCRCRKSRCQKKYCECFSAGLTCAENCICVDCDNGNGAGASHREKGDISRVPSGQMDQMDQMQSAMPQQFTMQTLAGAFAAGHILASVNSQLDTAVASQSALQEDGRSKPTNVKPVGARKRQMTVDLPAKAFPAAAVIPLSGPNMVSESQKLESENSGLHYLATFAAQQTPSPSIDFGAKGLSFDTGVLSAGSQPGGLQRFISDTSLLGGLWTPGAPASLGLPSPGPGSAAFASLPGSAFQMFQPWSPHEVMRSAGRTGVSCPAPWAVLAGGTTSGSSADAATSASAAAPAAEPRSAGLLPACNSLQSSLPPWSAGPEATAGGEAEGIRVSNGASSARA